MVNCKVCNKVIGFRGFANHVRKHKKELGEDIYVRLKIQRTLKDKSKWNLLPRPSYKQLVLNELYTEKHSQTTPLTLNSKQYSSYMDSPHSHRGKGEREIRPLSPEDEGEKA